MTSELTVPMPVKAMERARLPRAMKVKRLARGPPGMAAMRIKPAAIPASNRQRETVINVRAGAKRNWQRHPTIRAAWLPSDRHEVLEDEGGSHPKHHEDDLKCRQQTFVFVIPIEHLTLAVIELRTAKWLAFSLVVHFIIKSR